MKREGFVASPRKVVPLMLAVVLILALLSLYAGTASAVHAEGSLIVGLALVLGLGLLVLVSRSLNRRPPKEGEGAA